MGRQPCCDKMGLKRGPWTIDEDQKLINFLLNNGIQCWRLVPKLAGLMRCGKSCRLRWTNYLRPDLKRGALSEAEEYQIIQLHSRLGNRWSKIASHFPGRTDNEIKNHWNTRIKKRLKLLGLDPALSTHKPIEQSDSMIDQPNLPGVDEKRAETASFDVQAFGSSTKGLGALLDGNIGISWEVEEMKSQAKPSSCSSNSISVDDTLFPSMGGESCVEDSSNVDYFPSWDALYQLEDMLSFW